MAGTGMAEPGPAERTLAAIVLDSQLRTATGAATLQHVASTSGGHARHEAMLAQARDSLWLPGPLQPDSLSVPQQYTQRRRLRAMRRVWWVLSSVPAPPATRRGATGG